MPKKNCKGCGKSRLETCWNCGVSGPDGVSYVRVTGQHNPKELPSTRVLCQSCYRPFVVGVGLPDANGVNRANFDEASILSANE